MSTAAHPVNLNHPPEVNLTKFGMITFLASEAMLFAGLISAYVILWVSHGRGYVPDHLRAEHFTWPLVPTGINTLVLIASSGTLYMAEQAVLKAKPMVMWLGLTTVLGAAFVGWQCHEWLTLRDVDHIWWSSAGHTEGVSHMASTTFNSSFFALTGFHGLHVSIGVLFLAITTLMAMLGRFTPHRHNFLTCVSLYWHFVDVVWLLLFTVMYIVPFFFR